MKAMGTKKGKLTLVKAMEVFDCKKAPNQVRVVLALLAGLMLFGHESRAQELELDLKQRLDLDLDLRLDLQHELWSRM